MSRGSIYVVSLQGDYGKPRPAVVVQSDAAHSLASIVVCPMTTFPEDASDLRIAVEPSEANGLRFRSFVMVEKVMTVPRNKLLTPIGQLERPYLSEVASALAFLLDLA